VKDLLEVQTYTKVKDSTIAYVETVPWSSIKFKKRLMLRCLQTKLKHLCRVIPAHWSCDRICPPSKRWSTIFTFGLIQRIKFVPCTPVQNLTSPSTCILMSEDHSADGYQQMQVIFKNVHFMNAVFYRPKA